MARTDGDVVGSKDGYFSFISRPCAFSELVFSVALIMQQLEPRFDENNGAIDIIFTIILTAYPERCDILNYQIMTADDNMSDDVFEESGSNATSTGLTPGTTGQTLTTTPSPTGYRDYKPPAEVFAENYGYSPSDYDNTSSLKRVKEEDPGLTHKVSSPKIY